MPATHDLTLDLPEFRQRLEQPGEDSELIRLLEEYHLLDQRAMDLEKDDANSSSAELERSRKARVLVKDRIERHLRYGT